jgi:hypothetical protein
MGSHLNLDRLVELCEIAVDDPILLCLDRDATEKAYGFAARYRMLAPNLVPVPLDIDMKYMNDEEIRQLISYYG